MAFIVRKIAVYLECMRSRARALSYAWATIIGSMIASRGMPPIIPSLKATLAMTAVGLGVYIFNDVMDLENDRINRVNRPIARGEVSPKEAIGLVLMLYLIAVGLSISINSETFLLCAAAMMLGLAYSTPPVQLKKRFLLKQLTVAVGALISNLMGGAAIGVLNWRVLFAGLMFFAYAFALSPIVDLGDMKGDKAVGKKTFPVVLGPKLTVRLAIIIIILVMVGGVVGYYQLGFNAALPILVSIVCLAYIWIIYPLQYQLSRVDHLLLVKKMIALHLTLQFSIVIGAL